MTTIPVNAPIAASLARVARLRGAFALLITAGLLLVALIMVAGLVQGRDASNGARSIPDPERVAAAMPAPPPVPPTVLADVTADQARVSNAALPFAEGRVLPARPMLYAGAPADRVAALTCLAAAAWWEAGDDPAGERAVAQVVLNRLRHPAFPKTVCGVVFQGAERATGCQFTFACDGALARVPSAPAWRRARGVADAALAGHVEAAVGTATHYHTDWVVPYWRASLVKIAKVGTQIFYRWPGAWATPPASRGMPRPIETIDPRLVALAGPGLAVPSPRLPFIVPDEPANIPGILVPPPVPAIVAPPSVARAALHGGEVRLADGNGQFAVLLGSDAAPDSYAQTAAALCRDRADCLVWGWLDARQMPRALPFVPNGINGMTFLYRKSSAMGGAQPYWNCGQHPRREKAECLPGTFAIQPSDDMAIASVH